MISGLSVFKLYNKCMKSYSFYIYPKIIVSFNDEELFLLTMKNATKCSLEKWNNVTNSVLF